MIKKRLSNSDEEEMTYDSVDLDKGEIYLHGEICGAMTAELNAAMMPLAESKKHLTVYIHSGGGSVSDMYSIIEMLQFLKNKGVKITTVALGECCSAAAAIFLIGDIRIMSHFCYYMMHNFSITIRGVESEKAKADIKHMTGQWEKCLTYLLKDTNMVYDDLWEHIKDAKDWVVVPEDCMKLGIAHGYFNERKELNGKRKRSSKK